MKKLDRVLARLKKYDPEKVIVFGSYARGEADRFSDLDLVVIKRTKKRWLRRLGDVARLIGTDLGQVDVFVYTPQEFKRMLEYESPFLENVLKDGKVIYEKNRRRGQAVAKAGRI